MASETFYKRIGNRILTYVENRLLGSQLSEFHSGYRAYSVKAARRTKHACAGPFAKP